MTKPGIKVSSRKDVSVADPDELDYTSEAQSPKISKPYRGTLQLNARGFAEAIIDHELSYAPSAFAFYKLNDGDWFMVNNTSVGIDTSTDEFTVSTYDYGGDTPPPGVANGKLDYKVWLLLDPAQEILYA